MLPENAQSLNQSDLIRLDQFLRSAACGQESMNLSYAHGFLTAIASGPEQLEPSEWLLLMFDDPIFESGTVAQEMLGLAMRLFWDIELSLGGKTDFRAVFEYLRNPSGEVRANAQPWCRGYAAGFSLFSEMWSQNARNILHEDLGLILRMSNIRCQGDHKYSSLCDSVPKAAVTIYRFWQNS